MTPTLDLADRFEQEAETILADIQEGRPGVARERLFVLNALLRANAQRAARDKRSLTGAEADVVSRLAWALYDVTVNYGDRVADDLDGIEDAIEDL